MRNPLSGEFSIVLVILLLPVASGLVVAGAVFFWEMVPRGILCLLGFLGLVAILSYSAMRRPVKNPTPDDAWLQYSRKQEEAGKADGTRWAMENADYRQLKALSVAWEEEEVFDDIIQGDAWREYCDDPWPVYVSAFANAAVKVFFDNQGDIESE
jgi:hypothetical protein